VSPGRTFVLSFFLQLSLIVASAAFGILLNFHLVCVAGFGVSCLALLVVLFNFFAQRDDLYQQLVRRFEVS
jgi:hypothetical protein